MIKKQIVERVIVSMVGMTILGFGIGIIVNSKFGSDCLTLAIESFHNTWGLTVGTFNMIVGAIMLVIAFFCDKKKIGFSTVYYVVCCKFIIDTTIKYVPVATNIYMQLLYVLIAIVCCSFATALSVSARLGLAYYDAFIYSVSDKFKFNPVIFRYIVEAILLTISFFLHTYPGFGTLIYFIVLGPSISSLLKLIKKPLRSHWNMPFED